MLIKVDDGFYLNTQHIIAVRVSRLPLSGDFEVIVEYTSTAQQANLVKRKFSRQIDAESFLKELNEKIQ